MEDGQLHSCSRHSEEEKKKDDLNPPISLQFDEEAESGSVNETTENRPPVAATGPPRLAFWRANWLWRPRDLFRIDPEQASVTDGGQVLLAQSLLPPDGADEEELGRQTCCFVRICFKDEQISLAWEFIRPFGNYLGYCTLLTMTILVPMVIYFALKSQKVDTAAYRSAAVMVIGTVILSARLVYLHLTHWYMPNVQKYVVRILFIVPIYAIQSYLSIVFYQDRVYTSTIRDFYEAFVIASFVYYLMELLGGQESLARLLTTKPARFGQHCYPFKIVLPPWEMGSEFLLNCQHGTLQYVLFKTIATVVTIVCEAFNVLKEGQFTLTNAYGYLAFFQNMSVMYALYCLALFFHAVSEELREPIDWHPLGKFLCIKGVVFFTWWQGVLIFSLKQHGIIGRMGNWSSVEVANGLIDYCIVVEMVLFAIAHSYTFTYTEYLPGRYSLATEGRRYSPPTILHERMGFVEAFWSSTVPRETLDDIRTLQSGMIDRRFRRRVASTGEIRPAEGPLDTDVDEDSPTANESERSQTMT